MAPDNVPAEREAYDERYTFALSAALKARLEDEAYRQEKKGSYICRLALEMYLDMVQGRSSSDEPVEDSALKSIAAKTARRLGMDLGSFVNMVLSEHIEEYTKRAREHESRLNRIKEQLG